MRSCFGHFKVYRGNPTLELISDTYVKLKLSNEGRKDGNVLFNNALNTFYLRLSRIGHMGKDHSDSETGNLLPPHGLLFLISSKGYFICTIPQTGTRTNGGVLIQGQVQINSCK